MNTLQNILSSCQTMTKRKAVIFVFLQVFGLCSFAQPEAGNDSDSSSLLQQYVGCWHPNKPGWHGNINITTDGNKLYLTMSTDEGYKRFEEVKVNESEPSIEWSYKDESDALWYIGKWGETNREEILLDINHINASCGVPTEVYRIGIEANHSVKEWKYIAVMVNDELVISYGYKWDFLTPSNETVFMKSNRYMSAFTYRKFN